MHARTRTFIQERLLTTQELSDLTGVPAPTLQKWAERGKVDCVLKGRTYLFDREDFADFRRPPRGAVLPTPGERRSGQAGGTAAAAA
jgi:excisionase family DNA binding protein